RHTRFSRDWSSDVALPICDAKMGALHRYGPNQLPDKEGTIMYADFMIENCWLAAMDSAQDHKFNFNEAVSFMVYCDSQKEIDYRSEERRVGKEIRYRSIGM